MIHSSRPAWHGRWRGFHLAVLTAAALWLWPATGSAQDAETKMIKDGWAAFEKGEFKKALKLAQETIRSEAPKKSLRSEAYALRGGVYWKQSKVDRSLKDFSAAVQLNPTRSYWYYARGRVYYSQRKYKEAVEDLTSAIERKPKHLIAYDYLSKAYLRLGSAQAANRVIELQEQIIKKTSTEDQVAKAIRYKVLTDAGKK